jgi:hypothetical protein
MKQLENHADLRALRGKFRVVHGARSAGRSSPPDRHAFELDGPLRGGLKVVDGTKAGGFSRPARSYDGDPLTRRYIEGNAAQDFESPERLSKVVHAQKRLVGHVYIRLRKGRD